MRQMERFRKGGMLATFLLRKKIYSRNATRIYNFYSWSSQTQMLNLWGEWWGLYSNQVFMNNIHYTRSFTDYRNHVLGQKRNHFSILLGRKYQFCCQMQNVWFQLSLVSIGRKRNTSLNKDNWWEILYLWLMTQISIRTLTIEGTMKSCETAEI